MATAYDINTLSDDIAEHQEGETSTDDTLYKTAWKDFEIRLHWNAEHESVPVPSNEICHPCLFQYAFSYDRKLIEDALKKEEFEISIPLKEGFEIDALSKGCVSAQDAWADLHALLTGYFSHYRVITLPVNREKAQILMKAYEKDSNEYLFRNVALYIDKHTNVIHMVGYAKGVNNVLKELKLEMNEVVYKIDKDTWERLLPERLIREEAHVNITETGDVFMVSGDATEIERVKQVLKRIDNNSFFLDTLFDKNEHIELLIQNGRTNDSVYAYFQKRLRQERLDVFFEMFEESKKAVVRVHAKSRESAKAAYDVIKKSIVEFSLDRIEAVCVTDELNSWSRKKKLKSFQKRATLNIVCTSDVAKLIQEVDCDIDIPLPNMVCDYLTLYGNDIVESLRTKFNLKAVTFCPTQQSVRISGCLRMVQEFQKHLSEIYKLLTLTIHMPLESLAEHEYQIKAIGDSHQCLTTAEKVTSYRSCIFINCFIAAEWKLYDFAGNSSKVYIFHGDINNIHVSNENIAKLQFVNKSFESLQDVPMKQYEYQHEKFDVYRQAGNPGKLAYWHGLHMLPTSMTDAEWLVEIVVKNKFSLSKCLGDVFREAVERKCQCLVIPVELLRVISPSDIAGACINVLANIQYRFQVIFQCHNKANIGDVARCVETLFKKQDKLCIRENIHTDLSPNTDVHPIAVTLQKSSLTSLQVDVIVNTVSKELILNKGYLSRSILKSAGDKIQEECQTNDPNGIQYGDIAVTSAGNMEHKHIFHCALPRFHKHMVAENVKSMVWKCLIEADRRQCTSIAFPAFGTGKHRYPPRETASAMLEAIDEYKRRTLNSCLQKVMISVPDISEVFFNEYNRRQRRLWCTMGNGILDCSRLSIQYGNGIYATCLHVMSEKHVNLLSSQFVIICFKNGQSVDGSFNLLMDSDRPADRDRDILHDQCLVYLNEYSVSHRIKEAMKYLLSFNISDIAIDSRGIQLDSHQFVLDIIQLLQELTKEADKNNNALYWQNIVALVKNEDMLPLTKNLCPSSGFKSMVPTFMFTKPVWHAHTVPHIDVGFTILGKTDYHTSEVKRKLRTFLDLDGFEMVDQHGATNVDEAMDVLESDESPGDTRSEEENTDHLLLSESFDELVTAELNPGLVKFLKNSPLFKSWQDDVHKQFDVTLNYDGHTTVVSGSFEAILKFETFLEENTMENADDDSQQMSDKVYQSSGDLKPDIGNKDPANESEISSDDSEEDKYYTCSEKNSNKSSSSDTVDDADDNMKVMAESDTAQGESNSGVTKLETENIASGFEGKNSPKRPTDEDIIDSSTNASREEPEMGNISSEVDKAMDAAHGESSTSKVDSEPETVNHAIDVKGIDNPESLTNNIRNDLGMNSISGDPDKSRDENVQKFDKLLEDLPGSENNYSRIDSEMNSIINEPDKTMYEDSQRFREISEDNPETPTNSSSIESEPDKAMDNDSKKFPKIWDGAKSALSSIVDIDSAKPVSNFKLNGIKVCLLCGDLTKLRADCIVNSANEHLSESCGISRALAKAGGSDYNAAVKLAKKEYGALKPGTCIDTVSGGLPCHCVIHAVGPTSRWPKSDQERLQVLQETVEKCLCMADGNKHVSVAMPILGCGAGGMSENHCAIQYYRALTAFSSNKTRYLKNIYLVEIGDQRIRNIAAEFERLRSGSGDKLKTKETIQVLNQQEFKCRCSNLHVILLESKDLIRVKAEAIVCMENLASVDDGVIVSNLLLKNGGQPYVEITSELKKLYRDKSLKCQYVNEIPLKSSKLEYKYVLHSTIRESSKDRKQPDVTTIVKEALLKAADLKCRSVSLPVVGLTDKGSPVLNKPMWDKVIAGVCQYVADQRYSALQEIKIVCQTPAVFEYMMVELCKLQQFEMNSVV